MFSMKFADILSSLIFILFVGGYSELADLSLFEGRYFELTNLYFICRQIFWAS